MESFHEKVMQEKHLQRPFPKDIFNVFQLVYMIFKIPVFILFLARHVISSGIGLINFL